jgi:hypothetical protein
MPEGVLDLSQFMIYLSRKSNDYLGSELYKMQRVYNESTSFYRKMMRFFEDRNMMDSEHHSFEKTHQRRTLRYWSDVYKSGSSERVKFVGQVHSGNRSLSSKVAFVLKTSERSNLRSDKYIRGETLKYRLVTTRSRKILMKGPEFEGSSCKIKTQYIQDYNCLNLTYINIKMDRLQIHNLVTRSTYIFDSKEELLNYEITRRTITLAYP